MTHHVWFWIAAAAIVVAVVLFFLGAARVSKQADDQSDEIARSLGLDEE